MEIQRPLERPSFLQRSIQIGSRPPRAQPRAPDRVPSAASSMSEHCQITGPPPLLRPCSLLCPSLFSFFSLSPNISISLCNSQQHETTMATRGTELRRSSDLHGPRPPTRSSSPPSFDPLGVVPQVAGPPYKLCRRRQTCFPCSTPDSASSSSPATARAPRPSVSSRSPSSSTCTPCQARPRARRREQPEHLSDRRHRDSPGLVRPCVPCLLPAKFAAAVLFLPGERFASASRTIQARPALTLGIDRAK